MTLSVVVNTKNSAATLSQCLRSVAFADEIVVVDMKSTDATVAIAKKYTTKVFSHKDVGYVEPARNFALSKASSDWILLLDSDEELSASLAAVIKKVVAGQMGEMLQADCYYVPRKNLVFNSWLEHSGWWPDYVLRLFKKGHVDWPDSLHAIPVTTGVVREFPAMEELAIVHHNYATIAEFVTRLNRYSTIQAKELVASNLTEQISAEELWHAFQAEFFARFFGQQGYADGTHGLLVSLLQASSELVKTAKVWEEQGSLSSKFDPTQTLRLFQSDLNYWLADYQVKHTLGIQKLWWRFRRKYKI